MYKLFLTFRYLTRKAIVIFPILVVWLCVMMLIIVTSIMGGFVERVQESQRQLSGDIVIDSSSLAGFPGYQELQSEIEKLPEVETVTPMIRTFGLINLPEYQFNNGAQIVGIDPVGRSKIGSFRQSLFRQYSAPIEAADDLVSLLPATGQQLHEAADRLNREAVNHYRALPLTPTPLNSLQVLLQIGGGVSVLLVALLLLIVIWRYAALWRWLGFLVALGLLLAGARLFWNVWAGTNVNKLTDRLEDMRSQAQGVIERSLRTLDMVEPLDPARVFQNRQELLEALMPKAPSFTPPEEAVLRYGTRENMPEQGCIVGVDLIRGMLPRDQRGNYRHPREFRYLRAVLTIMPISTRGNLVKEPQKEQFVIVDDAYTRVYDVDSTYVYAPFKTVQQMAMMQESTDPDGVFHPARCSELQIRVKNGRNAEELRANTRRINALIARFVDSHPDLDLRNLIAQTWDQKQATYIDAVRNEKHLITFILGLMSMVVLVVIFLIFYMIVRDKTRDIGIIKALGGSEEGVAGIFMCYGLSIGLVGGIMGMITGVAFVWHTNEIHEWIYRTTGFMLWNRKVYIFDRIPDVVNWHEVLVYVAAAVGAGLLGALIPAIVAGIQDPVRAVRYE